MSVELGLSGFSIVVTLLGALFLFFNSRRANKTTAQVAEDAREDVIARRRKEELDRLYARVELLEADLSGVNERLETAEDRLESSDRMAGEMFRHIVLLERLVPDPPGPPTRPNWHLPHSGRK